MQDTPDESVVDVSFVETNTNHTDEEERSERFKTLNGKTWLNDEVVNTLVETYLRDHSHQTPTRHYLFNSMFWGLVQSKHDLCITFHRVKRWTLRHQCYSIDEQRTLFDKDNVLHWIVNYPTNLHWMYVVVDMGRHSITIMDSLNIVATKRKVGNFVLEYLTQEFQDKKEDFKMDSLLFNQEKWMVNTTCHSPNQLNNYDCGVFAVLNFVHTYILSASSLPEQIGWSKVYSAADKRNIRQVMCDILVHRSRAVGELADLVNDTAHNDHTDGDQQDDTDENSNNHENANNVPVNVDHHHSVVDVTDDAVQKPDDKSKPAMERPHDETLALGLNLSSLYKDCQVVVSIKMNEETIDFQRVPNAQSSKVAYLITPGRRTKYGIPLLYHYHEYTGTCSGPLDGSNIMYI